MIIEKASCYLSRRYIIEMLFFSMLIPVFPQNSLINGFLENGVLVGTNQNLPFWMFSNQFGRFSPKPINGYLDFGLFIDTLNTGINKLKVTTGLEGFLRYDKTWNGWIHQGYVETTLGKFSAFIGNKEEHFGIQDPSLSSGFILWSGNSRPFPKVTINLQDWVEIPFMKHFVHLKAGFAHGWFGNDGYVKKAFFQHTYFYLRFGGNNNFHLNLGVHHVAQWGGISPEFGELPNSFLDFIKVLLVLKTDTSNVFFPQTERHNRLGNHLGTRDVSFGYQFTNGTKFLFYWQNFIEDITGLGFRNAMDGLWGLQISMKNNLEFCYEFVNTLTDPSLTIVNGIIPGIDDYFNNRIYGRYAYKGNTIGTPFITSPVLFIDMNNLYYIANNRLRAHYIAFSYAYRFSKFEIKYSYTNNYGYKLLLLTPSLKQHSIYFMLERNFSYRYHLGYKIAAETDIGKFLGNRIGLSLSIKYYFK